MDRLQIDFLSLAFFFTIVGLTSACTQKLDNRFDDIKHTCGNDHNKDAVQYSFKLHDGTPVTSPQDLQVSWRAPEHDWTSPENITSTGCVELPATARGILAVNYLNGATHEGVFKELDGTASIGLSFLKLVPHSQVNFEVWRDCGDWPEALPNKAFLYGKIFNSDGIAEKPNGLIAVKSLTGNDTGKNLTLSERGCVAIEAPLRGFLWIYSPTQDLSFTTDFAGMNPGPIAEKFVLEENHHLSLIHQCGAFTEALPDGSRVVKYLGADNREVYTSHDLEAFFLAPGEKDRALPVSSRGCVSIPPGISKGRLLARINSRDRVWALTTTLSELKPSDNVLTLRNFAQATLFVTCTQEPHYTNGVLRIPLDITNAVDFASYDVSVSIRKPGSTSPVIPDVTLQNPEQSLKLNPGEIAEGRYDLAVLSRRRHTSEGSASLLKSCPLIVDFQPPTVSFGSNISVSRGDDDPLELEPHEVLPMEVADAYPGNRVFYCFIPQSQALSVNRCEFKQQNGPLRVPDSGRWEFRYFIEDSAGNTVGHSEKPKRKKLFVFDKSRISTIRTQANLISQYMKDDRILDALVLAIRAGKAWEDLKTDDEKETVKHDLLPALVKVDQGANVPIEILQTETIQGKVERISGYPSWDCGATDRWTAQVEFSADGSAILVSDQAGNREAWNLKGESVDPNTLAFEGTNESQITSEELSTEETLFTARTDNGELIWQAALKSLSCHANGNANFAFCTDSHYASFTGISTISAYYLGYPYELKVNPHCNTKISEAGTVFSSWNTESIEAFRGVDVYAFNDRSWQMAGSIPMKTPPNRSSLFLFPQVQYSLDDSVLSVLQNEKATIWDLQRGNLRISLRREAVLTHVLNENEGSKPVPAIHSVTFSPTHQLVASLDSKNRIFLWQVRPPWSNTHTVGLQYDSPKCRAENMRIIVEDRYGHGILSISAANAYDCEITSTGHKAIQDFWVTYSDQSTSTTHRRFAVSSRWSDQKTEFLQKLFDKNTGRLITIKSVNPIDERTTRLTYQVHTHNLNPAEVDTHEIDLPLTPEQISTLSSFENDLSIHHLLTLKDKTYLIYGSNIVASWQTSADDVTGKPQFTLDYQRILTAPDEYTLAILNTQTGNPIKTRKFSISLCKAALSPKGDKAVMLDSSGNVHVWNSSTDNDHIIFEGASCQTSSVEFSPRGETIVIMTEGQTQVISEKSNRTLWGDNTNYSVLNKQDDDGFWLFKNYYGELSSMRFIDLSVPRIIKRLCKHSQTFLQKMEHNADVAFCRNVPQ